MSRTAQTTPIFIKVTLTTGVDISGELKGDANTVSTAGNNRFSANQTTLTAGDRLDGGDGSDTLQVTTTAAATLGAGVVTASIEEVSATATVGALDLNVGTFAGVTTLTSSGSTAGVTFSNVQVIPTVNVTATSSDVTVSMAAAATAGIADAITINLNTAATNGNNTVTVNGIEKVTVVGTGTSGNTNADGSVFATTIVSNSIRELVISGTGTTDLAVNMAGAQTGTTGAAATVTGSAGADDLQLSTPEAASKLSASLGAGNDILRVSNVNAAQTISGGDGTDTLVYTGTTAVAATATANITGFEKVVLSGPASFAYATSDLTYTASATGTYTGLAAGGTVALQAGGTLTLANTALTGSTDAVTVTVGRSTTTAPLNATIAAGEFDVVTVNAVARADVLSTTSATYTVTGTTLNKVTLVSSQGAVLAGGGTALTTIDASGVKGAFSNTATTSATASLSITGGDGNDNISGGAKGDVLVGNAGNDTLTGGVGADTLTGGAGNDTFVIGANGGTADTAFSSSTVTDVITDFESGKDRLQLSQAVNAFVGNVANVQLGLAAMTGANQAFFVTSENTLYVVSGFANNAGVIANTDTIVKLTGVTALTAADLAVGSSSGGADLTLTNAAGELANVTLTASSKARVTTDYTANLTTNTTGINDTIRANSSQMESVTTGSGQSAVTNYTTLTGGNGVDTLVLTGGNASGSTSKEEMSLVTGFENITLGETTVTGGTTAGFDLSVDDANIAAVEGTLTISAAGISTVAVKVDASAVNGDSKGRLSITGGSYALGAGDTLTGGSFNDTINGGAGNDVITGGAGNDVLNGGTGDDTIVAAGTDVIDGGAGNDVVQIAGALGGSTTDLASIELGAGVNRIQFTGNGTTANATVAATGGVYDILLDDGVTATMTTAQFAGAYRVLGTSGNSAEGITFSNSGTIDLTTTTDITNVTLSGVSGSSTTGSNTVTAAATTTSITGAGGNDTINVASGSAAVAVLQGAVDGQGGTNVINVTGNSATSATLGAGVINIGTISFANTTTDVTLTTRDENLNSTQTLTVNATSLTDGKLTFTGTSEASGKYVVNAGGAADTIRGGGGADSVTAGAGNDIVLGLGGADTLSGGTGADFLYGDGHGTKSVAAFTIATAADGGSVVFNILGTDFTITGSGTAGAQATALAGLINASGVATASVSTATITITAIGDGNLFGVASGLASNITVRSTGTVTTAMAITDGADSDSTALTVGTSALPVEILSSGLVLGAIAATPGADSILGGDGNDFISGGGGADTITGGAGNDVFVFSKEMSTLASLTTITDYRATGAGSDIINLTNVTEAAGSVATVQDFSAQASLGAALNAAAASNTVDNGLVVFIYGGNTYFLVETDTNDTTTFVATDFLLAVSGTPFTTSTALTSLGFGTIA